MAEPELSLARAFADLPDPRVERTKKHALPDILAIALCAVVCGADSWEDIEEFGRAKEGLFRRCLALPNGIPSHDTFYRVFTALDPVRFGECFARWMAGVCAATGLRPIAIDGKAVRGTPGATASGCLHLVSAWATENHLVLGQRAVAEGSNEITAIPELLRALDLEGALVTIDAVGCQTAIAAQIREQDGDYLLAVKGNQPGLHDALLALFERALDGDFAGYRHDAWATEEDGHGRHEGRYVTVLYDPPGLPDGWPDVAAVVMVTRERQGGGQHTCEAGYYLTSLGGTAAELGKLVRGHWGIENGLHWVLDVAFREDACRTRAGHAGANLGLLRRIAASLLKRAPGKRSIRGKRLRAGWDDEFLLQVLQGLDEDLDA
jgi:predicted transposase YbfD/YdcC